MKVIVTFSGGKDSLASLLWVCNIARKLLFGYRKSKRMTEVYDDRIRMKGIQGSI